MAALRVLILSLGFIASLQGIPLNNKNPTKIEVLQEDYLQLLINNLIKSPSADVCTDFYSNTCNQLQSDILVNYNFKRNIANAFSNTMAIFSNILNNTNYESKAFNIEQKLFENCMKLNKSDKISKNLSFEDLTIGILDRFTIKTLFDDMLEKINEKINESDWRDIENKLVSFGYDHLLFDISVIDDPLEPFKRIILLEPPSLKKWSHRKFPDISVDILIQLEKDTYEFCKKASKLLSKENSDEFSFKKISEPESMTDNETYWFDEFRNHENTENLILLCQSFQNLSKPIRELPSTKTTVLEIYNQIANNNLKAAHIHKKQQYKKLTIKSWANLYNKSVRNNITRIEWLQIFRNKFEPLGITIDEDEPIIVKNVQYFLNMSNILRWFPNKYFVEAVRLKFISDNIRYFNWNWAQSMNYVHSSSFCFQETKLYGVSGAVLQLLKGEYLENYLKNIANVKNNIVNAVSSMIVDNQVLSDKEKTFLILELQKITENIIESNQNMKLIANYYGHYELTGDYFIDILNYRTLLKNKNYCSLRNTPLTKHLPFSINDIHKPRNRFILHALLNAIVAKPIFLSASNKEIYYATYGVNMGAYLYSLLRENTLENLNNEYLYDRTGSEWLIPHGSYPPKVVNCFIRENIFKYGFKSAYETITEVVGIKIAYKAMLNDSTNSMSNDFFKTYIQTQCKINNEKITKKVLSNLDEFHSTFDCIDSINETEKCNITAFDF